MVYPFTRTVCPARRDAVRHIYPTLRCGPGVSRYTPAAKALLLGVACCTP
jgi:hypothetical protein